MSTIAVIGGSGRVGRAFLRALGKRPEKHRLLVVDAQPWQGPLDADVQFFRIDVRNRILPELLAAHNVETVVHLASASRQVLDPERMHEVNVIGTMNVIRACQAAKVDRLLVASSTLVYGARADNPMYLTEDRSPRPNRGNAYARDKAEVERLTMTYGAKNPDVCVQVIRPCTCVESPSLSLLAPLVTGGSFPRILGHDPLVQAISMRDLARALVCALTTPVPGVFNAVGKGVVPLSTAVALTGRRSVPIPMAAAQMLVAGQWVLRKARISPGALDLLRYPVIASGQKAATELGFIPRDDANRCFSAARLTSSAGSENGDAREDTLLEALRAGSERLELDRIMSVIRKGAQRLDEEGRGAVDRVSQ